MEYREHYAVIFSSQRHQTDNDAYDETADKMVRLAKQQVGFIGVESARDENGFGITVSYWSSLDAIKAWKANTDHQLAQELGRSKWYESFKTRICRVEREYES